MVRYEYRIVELKGIAWWRPAAASRDRLLELLEREGRAGWRLVVTHQPGLIPWNSVLLERMTG